MYATSFSVPVAVVDMILPLTSVVRVKENNALYFICSVSGFPAADIRWFKDSGTPQNDSDDIRITENIFHWSSELLEDVSDWSIMRYTAYREDNGVSIYCTGNNTANRYPVVSGLKPVLIIQGKIQV